MDGNLSSQNGMKTTYNRHTQYISIGISKLLLLFFFVYQSLTEVFGANI